MPHMDIRSMRDIINGIQRQSLRLTSFDAMLIRVTPTPHVATAHAAELVATVAMDLRTVALAVCRTAMPPPNVVSMLVQSTKLAL